MIYFVEYLTVRTWVAELMPRVLSARFRGQRELIHCHVIESSRWGLRIARITGRWLGIIVEPLTFRFTELRDEHGLALRLRLAYQDLAEVQRDAIRDPAFQSMLQEIGTDDRLSMYLTKSLAAIDLMGRGTFWRSLALMHICARHKESWQDAVLVLERQPWLAALERAAANVSVELMMVPPSGSVPQRLRQIVRAAKRRARVLAPKTPVNTTALQRPRIATTYYGQLNLNQPERYSDLFFVQDASMSGRDVMVLFEFPQDPLDDEKAAELSRHGIHALGLNAHAVTASGIPIWTSSAATPPLGRNRSASSIEATWLKHHQATYHEVRAFWRELCAAHDLRLYMTWYKYDAAHCAIADALQDVGGIFAMYQRAYEANPSAETALAADVMFGWSSWAAQIEQQSGSQISYWITTGYIGDHRFPLLREYAAIIRESLHQHGAKHILAYADESTKDNATWNPGHHLSQRDYTFLLEKVLANPLFGLVIKPKRPIKLRARLGPVAHLLTRAEATGRCVVLEGGILHGSYPPAAAALAADVMVHGQLFSATAGVESALAGVPTLLMDHEGWAMSPLYRLGVGRVVFHTWDHLWTACQEQWAHPEKLPGFGDWSSMLNEIDPFRDGQAALRVSIYLQWLLEGLAAGHHRDTVMADAAQRYATQWGKNHVASINATPKRDVQPQPEFVGARS